jgi:hypothetical protein
VLNHFPAQGPSLQPPPKVFDDTNVRAADPGDVAAPDQMRKIPLQGFSPRVGANTFAIQLPTEQIIQHDRLPFCRKGMRKTP